MELAANTGAAIGQCRLLGLVDQLGNCPHAGFLARDEQICRRAKNGDWSKIPLDVKRQVRDERRIDGEVSCGNDEQGCAVGAGATRRIDADIAGAACSILHAHGISGARPILLREKASEDIDRPARRKRRDQHHRSRWKIRRHIRSPMRTPGNPEGCRRRNQCVAPGDKCMSHG